MVPNIQATRESQLLMEETEGTSRIGGTREVLWLKKPNGERKTMGGWNEEEQDFTLGCERGSVFGAGLPSTVDTQGVSGNQTQQSQLHSTFTLFYARLCSLLAAVL